MKISQGFVRGFHHYSTASYYEPIVKATGVDPEHLDSITIGFYSESTGGTLGEFSLVWKELSGKKAVVLRVYDDAFEVLNEFLDLVVWLKDYNNADLQPSQVIEMLLSHGVKDFTQKSKPANENNTSLYQDFIDYISQHEDEVGTTPNFIEMTEEELKQLQEEASVWIDRVDNEYYFHTIKIKIKV